MTEPRIVTLSPSSGSASLTVATTSYLAAFAAYAAGWALLLVAEDAVAVVPRPASSVTAAVAAMVLVVLGVMDMAVPLLWWVSARSDARGDGLVRDVSGRISRHSSSQPLPHLPRTPVMSVRLTTLPSLAVIGAVVLLGSTGAVGGVLISGSESSGGAVTTEDVNDDAPRTGDLDRDTGIKLRRTRERGAGTR